MRKAFSYPTKPSSPVFSMRHGIHGDPLPVSPRSLNFIKEPAYCAVLMSHHSRWTHQTISLHLWKEDLLLYKNMAVEDLRRLLKGFFVDSPLSQVLPKLLELPIYPPVLRLK